MNKAVAGGAASPPDV